MLFIVVWKITLTCGLDGGVARTCHKRHRRINSSNVWLLLIDSILKRKWNKNLRNSMKMCIRSSFNLENWLISRYFFDPEYSESIRQGQEDRWMYTLFMNIDLFGTMKFKNRDFNLLCTWCADCGSFWCWAGVPKWFTSYARKCVCSLLITRISGCSLQCYQWEILC